MKLQGLVASGFLALLSGLAGSPASAAEVPAGYPANYADTIKAAEAEGTLVIYAATDESAVAPLLKDFMAVYPKIQVKYNDMGSSEVYNRFLSEAAAGTQSADFLMSPAMDLQIKLAIDGYAMTYRSPEADKLPAWSIFHDQAYGITYEPIVFIYNKRLLKEEQVPKSHAAIANMDQATIDLLKGKVITQDPERIGSALLFVTRDLKYDKNFWNLAQSLGKTDVKLYTSSGTILERLTSGEASFGYDVMANYPHTRSKTDPAVGIVYPEDYILVNPRVAFIWKDAAHPNAAKVFLDYVLSARGQTLIAKSLFSIRPDVQGEFSANALIAKYGEKLRPLTLDASAVEYLDKKKRLEFLDTWKKSIETK